MKVEKAMSTPEQVTAAVKALKAYADRHQDIIKKRLHFKAVARIVLASHAEQAQRIAELERVAEAADSVCLHLLACSASCGRLAPSIVQLFRSLPAAQQKTHYPCGEEDHLNRIAALDLVVAGAAETRVTELERKLAAGRQAIAAYWFGGAQAGTLAAFDTATKDKTS